jgi:NAD(P)-dependent dehydrogenase (short-subunit alcohol dehydrogenase family)
MTGPLDGKVALVTGGGRGLGAAICEALGRAGATVVVGDARAELGEQTAQRLAAAACAATAETFDVGDENACRTALDRIVGRHGRLDVLVNNAGVDYTLPIEELAVAQWDHVLATNLRGPFLLTRLVVPLMKRGANGSPGGHIVNIASTAAKRAWPNASAYHASKWGLLGFSHAMHAELRPHGIKVTAVIAGGMRTPFLLDRFPDLDPAVLQDPAHVAAAVRDVLCMAPETVVPEITVIPMRESSWP